MEDYTYLKNFLDEYFIPKYAKKRNRISVRSNKEFGDVVQLSKIEQLRLDDDELDYTFKYLSKFDICIVGNSPALYSNYSNYFYTNNEISYLKSNELGEKEQKELIKKYQKDKTDIESRNKVIEANYSLINTLAYKYSYITGIEKEDLLLAGAEELVRAMDDVNPNSKMINYIYVRVMNKILDEVAFQQGLTNDSFYNRYLKARKKIIDENSCGKDFDEYDYVEDIIYEIIGDKENYSKFDYSIMTKCYMAYAKSLDEYVDDEDVVDDNTLYNEVIEAMYQDDLVKIVDEVVEELPPKQKEIIKKMYYENMMQTDIAEEMNVGPTTVNMQKKKVFKKLREDERLKGLLGNIPKEYDYDPKNIR